MPESFFLPTPTTPYVSDSPVTVGMQFTVGKNGLATGVRFFKDARNTGAVEVALFEPVIGGSGGQVIASGNFAGSNDEGWTEVMFTTPASIGPGNTYTVAVFTSAYAADNDPSPNSFAAANGYPKTNNDITVGPSAGVFNYSTPPALAYPTSVYNDSNYYIDIIFEAGAAPAVTPGVLSLGVFSPWNPSLNNGAGADDFAMWGTFVGEPETALINMGMGIAQQGSWDNYGSPSSGGSAYSVAQAWLTINNGQPLADGQNEVNMGPFPDGVGGTLTQAGSSAGPYDQYWQAVVNQFIGAGWHKVRFRLCWEFEGGWYPWGFNSGSQNQSTYAADYIATFRRMVSVIRALMPEATFVFCAADGQTMNSPTWESCYPGDDVVDMIGIDVYCANGRDQSVTDPTVLWNNEAASGVSRSQALALAHKKPWGIFETAVGAGALPDNPNWILSLATSCQQIMQQGINAYIGYWNQNYSNATTGLGGLPNSFAQYQKKFPQGFHS